MKVPSKFWLGLWQTSYHLASTFLAPLFLFPLFSKKRKSLRRLRLAPPPRVQHPLFWIHALSVGETQAARPLLKTLRKTEKGFFLFTVTTASAFSLLQKGKQEDFDLLWASPLDLWPIRKKFLEKLRPSLYVLIETDVWPGLLWSMKRQGTILCLANAALSEKAYRRIKKFPALADFLFGPFHLIGAATRGDQARFQDLLPQREILYLGNLKFDVPSPDPKEIQPLEQDLKPYLTPPVIVCGSTHEGEETLWLKVMKRLKHGTLLLCPRHIERAKPLLKEAQQLGLPASLKTQPRKTPVLIVDTLGELKKIYALADVAFVGGSLVPVGGHNLLEPALWGKPVLFGPYVESIADLAAELLEKGAALRVFPSEGNILEALETALRQKEVFGRRALEVARAHRGAAKRYAQKIANLLKKHCLHEKAAFNA